MHTSYLDVIDPGHRLPESEIPFATASTLTKSSYRLHPHQQCLRIPIRTHNPLAHNGHRYSPPEQRVSLTRKSTAQLTHPDVL